MGARKRFSAEAFKKESKKIAFAKLNNCPTSPRKMRYAAALVRGVDVEKAIHILKHSSLEASGRLHKLLLSAIANWQAKNEGVRIEDAKLIVKEISVDSGRVLRRIQTAPQGRAYRIRKPSNHVTLIVDNKEETVKN
jgi:large subunit ribosomal protein L22